jgi:integrase
VGRGTEYQLGKLKGRYVVTWPDEGTGRRRRYRLSKGITASEAATELDSFVRDREKVFSAEIHTIADLFPPYLRDRELDGKPTAKQVHSWKALKPVFGHLKPGDVDKATCRAYAKLRTDKGRSAGTAWTELSVLRAALNWAEKEKKIVKAPFITLPQAPKPKDRHLTREEANRLHDCGGSPHIQLFIRLALATAGRASALLELEWDRVFFDRGLIDLRTAEQNRVKRRAVVPINESLREALVDAQPGAMTSYVIEWHGKRVRSIKRAFARACERAGLKDVTPHTLRHTSAVWMAEAGLSMSLISQYLGHSDSRITERIYARYSPDYLRQASNALEMPAGNRRLIIDGGSGRDRTCDPTDVNGVLYR